MRLRVPGNVLIAGEYLVLEPGGLGLCMAVDEYVQAEAEPAARLRIEGVQGKNSVVWTEETSGASPLFSELVNECGRELGEEPPRLSIRVDSSSHLYPDGRKKGLGSSAAVSVAMAALLLRSRLSSSMYLSAVFRVALAAHRRAQGGRGSGYDVAASTFGGLGLFIGGEHPRYEKLSPPALPNMTLVRGPEAVSTVSSVTAYETWKRHEPETASLFFTASNGVVHALAESRTALDFVSSLDRAAELGRKVGEAIGVSASMDAAIADRFPTSGVGRPGLKALGAGNELGLAYSLGPLSGPPLRSAMGGIEWLEE
jgi:phosphomevalonate kinase